MPVNCSKELATVKFHLIVYIVPPTLYQLIFDQQKAIVGVILKMYHL